MAEAVKIENGSVCAACNTTPLQEQCVQCFVCESQFHAVCKSGGAENQYGSQTMVKTFGAASTKNNFKFFCDICLTNYDLSSPVLDYFWQIDHDTFAGEKRFLHEHSVAN